jgi:hypothetical protein
MSHLKIDAEELIMALEDHSYEVAHFLDLKTGEVLPVFQEMDFDENDEVKEQIDADPFRYRRIEPLPSSVAFNVMADFVETLLDSEASRHLANALQKRRPFRNFKDTLLHYSDLREEWFRFHDQQLAHLADEWLKDESVDAELTHVTRN